MMPFGMGPAGWAYGHPYAYPYSGGLYPVWSRWGGWGRGWGRGRGWGCGRGWGRGWGYVAPYWHRRWW